MANSKYEYVRSFERDETLLPNTWIVIRVDGRGFHKLSKYYNFEKPNDHRALSVMNDAAKLVLQNIPDVCIAYGVSDEYSFVFHRTTNLFERRASKLISTVASTFTAAYVIAWRSHFEGTDLSSDMLPTFDARAVCYPTVANLRDYMSWRQVDCHINNLYNTAFWNMVQKAGMSATAAEEELKGTVAADKNEILFSRFQINYNDEPEQYKKGSVCFREYEIEQTSAVKAADIGAPDEVETTALSEPISKTQAEKTRKARNKARVVIEHLDIIRDEFWQQRPWIVSGKPGKVLER